MASSPARARDAAVHRNLQEEIERLKEENERLKGEIGTRHQTIIDTTNVYAHTVHAQINAAIESLKEELKEEIRKTNEEKNAAIESLKEELKKTKEDLSRALQDVTNSTQHLTSNTTNFNINTIEPGANLVALDGCSNFYNNFQQHFHSAARGNHGPTVLVDSLLENSSHGGDHDTPNASTPRARVEDATSPPASIHQPNPSGTQVSARQAQIANDSRSPIEIVANSSTIGSHLASEEALPSQGHHLGEDHTMDHLLFVALKQDPRAFAKVQAYSKLLQKVTFTLTKQKGRILLKHLLDDLYKSTELCVPVATILGVPEQLKAGLASQRVTKQRNNMKMLVELKTILGSNKELDLVLPLIIAFFWVTLRLDRADCKAMFAAGGSINKAILVDDARAILAYHNIQECGGNSLKESKKPELVPLLFDILVDTFERENPGMILW